MRLTIYHNPSAGNGTTTREDLLAAFRAEGFDPAYTAKGADEEVPDPSEVVVIAGGDGTVKRAIERFNDQLHLFAILPLGGANNIATALHLPASVPDLARLLRAGAARPFWTGQLFWPHRKESFVEAVGVGALARSASEAKSRQKREASETLNKIAAGRDSLHALLADASPIGTKILIDGRPIPEDTLFAEVLNVGVTGPSLHLAERIAPGDRVTVALLREKGRQAFRDALSAGKQLPVELRTGAMVECARLNNALRVDDDFCARPDAHLTLRISRSQTPSAMIVAPDPGNLS